MKDIYTFKFWKHKCGPELLVDIVDYAEPLCRQIRLAGSRLLYTDATIDKIADAMGFETSTYFIRTFRKRYGVTPLQFRKQDENPRNRG